MNGSGREISSFLKVIRRLSCKFEADADLLLSGPFMKHLSAQWQVIQTLKCLAEKGFK